MAKLGDAFSEPERKRSILRRLIPGADMSKFKGRVHRDVLNEIAAAVKRAPTLSTAEQTRLVESLLREGD